MNFFSSSSAVAYRDSACDCALHNKHCCSGSCFKHDGCRFLEQENPLCLLISSEGKTRDETVITGIKKIPFCFLTIVTFHPTIYYILRNIVLRIMVVEFIIFNNYSSAFPVLLKNINIRYDNKILLKCATSYQHYMHNFIYVCSISRVHMQANYNNYIHPCYTSLCLILQRTVVVFF